MPMSSIYLSKADAISFVKKHYRPGVAHFVRGGAFIYSQLPDGEGTARGWDGTCLIKVSQKAALKYIEEVFPDSWNEKGGKLQITISTDNGDYDGKCIFIG